MCCREDLIFFINIALNLTSKTSENDHRLFFTRFWKFPYKKDGRKSDAKPCVSGFAERVDGTREVHSHTEMG